MYTLLKADKKSEDNGTLSRKQLAAVCVKDMVSALELTERMDGYLAPNTQQKRGDAVTRSAVGVVLRGMIATVVKKSYPQSTKVLRICNKYKRAVSSGLHLRQLPTVKRRPSLNVVRKALL